jgi:hypothetical protein
VNLLFGLFCIILGLVFVQLLTASNSKSYFCTYPHFLTLGPAAHTLLKATFNYFFFLNLFVFGQLTA